MEKEVNEITTKVYMFNKLMNLSNKLINEFKDLDVEVSYNPFDQLVVIEVNKDFGETVNLYNVKLFKAGENKESNKFTYCVSD